VLLKMTFKDRSVYDTSLQWKGAAIAYQC